MGTVVTTIDITGLTPEEYRRAINELGVETDPEPGIVLIESDDFLTFRCGGDSRLVVTRSATGTSEPQTKASWRVNDLAAEVTELRSRGIDVEDYDEPGLKTVDGIADVGCALAAWFIDPHRNSIGLLEFKHEGTR